MKLGRRIRALRPAKTPRGMAQQLERFLCELQAHSEAAAHYPGFAAVLAPFIEELHRQADTGLRRVDEAALDEIRNGPEVEIPKPH
jgi:hypothetical protein